MRIGVVSDVHNNVEALRYAVAQLAGCELLLSLGDLVSDYRVTPDILRVAREVGLVCIVGNHEKSILFHPGSVLRYKLAPDDLAYLQAQPARRELAIDGRQVLVAHGAPWDDPDDVRCQYVTANDKADLARVGAVAADVVLLGHTHLAMSVHVAGTLVLNPGSCGEARDAARRLSYAELDFAAGVASTFQIHHGREPELIIRAEL